MPIRIRTKQRNSDTAAANDEPHEPRGSLRGVDGFDGRGSGLPAW